MLTEEEHRILRENEGKVFHLDVKSGIHSALYSYLDYTRCGSLTATRP